MDLRYWVTVGLEVFFGQAESEKIKGCFLHNVTAAEMRSHRGWVRLRCWIKLSPENFLPGNPAGESVFVKHVNLNFCSEKKGNGKRKLL